MHLPKYLSCHLSPPSWISPGRPNARWQRVSPVSILPSQLFNHPHPLVNDILCAPGQMHELQTILISGQLHRVYKNLMPSLRVFWMWAAQEHKDAIYLVFENQRFTFAQIFERSVKAAAIFYDVYNVRKGEAHLTFACNAC